jgi:hypothetical protein
VHADLAGQYQIETIVRLVLLDQHRAAREAAHFRSPQDGLQILDLHGTEQREGRQLGGGRQSLGRSHVVAHTFDADLRLPPEVSRKGRDSNYE